MSSPWDPPPGYFPDALTWFHPANIGQFHPIFRGDSNCNYILGVGKISNFSPPCDGLAIGKPVHLWKGDPPILEAWSTIDACEGLNYISPGLALPTGGDYLCAIGQPLPAKLHDFWLGTFGALPPDTPCAIRYGWFFSARQLKWWTHYGLAMYWAGPA